MKVRDRVIMTKVAQKEFPTSFITGVVTRVVGSQIRVKRDGYRGHEGTGWYKGWWRKLAG